MFSSPRVYHQHPSHPTTNNNGYVNNHPHLVKEGDQERMLEASTEAIMAWKRRCNVREEQSATSPRRRRFSNGGDHNNNSFQTQTHGVLPFGNVSAKKRSIPSIPLQTPLVDVLALPHHLYAPTAPLPSKAVAIKELLHYDVSSMNSASISSVEAQLSTFSTMLTPEQFDRLLLNVSPPTTATAPESYAPKDILPSAKGGEPTTYLNCTSLVPSHGPGRKRCSRRALTWDTTHHAIPMLETSLDGEGGPSDAQQGDEETPMLMMDRGGDRHGASRYFHRGANTHDGDAHHPLEPRREMHANRVKSQTSTFSLNGVDVGAESAPDAVVHNGYPAVTNDWVTPTITKAPVPAHRQDSRHGNDQDDTPSRHKSQRLLRESIMVHKGYHR